MSLSNRMFVSFTFEGNAVITTSFKQFKSARNELK